MATLKIGDEVNWRGAWGRDAAQKTTVESIEVTNGGKHGDNVDSIEWSKVVDRDVVVDLANGCWAYGNQISRIY